MKAQELMVGDYVTIQQEPINHLRVVAITNDYIEVADEDNHGGLEEYPPSALNGIPITPEILEENGFSQDPLNGHIFIFHEKSGEVIYYEYGPKYGLTIDNQLAIIQDLKIKHVHEFQHALRLCGIEKEIEL